jgi:hypothetical protein
MQYPVEVILQRTAGSAEVEACVFDAVGQLEEFCDHILGCQVFICGPDATDAGIFAVNLKVRTPDCEITIAGHRRRDCAHRDLRSALHDAFSHAERELRALALPLCSCSGSRAHADARI